MKISSTSVFFRLIYLILFCVYSISGFAQNLPCCNILTNGDFEQGDTLFSSGLPMNCACTSNSYCVGTNLQNKCPGWDNFTGNGGGQFMIIDGSPFGPVDVWQNTVVLTNQGEYCFSFWIASQYASAFDLGFMINGTLQGGPFTISQANGPIWTEYSGTVFLSPGTHNIAIRQLSGGAERDFGIDDISFGTSLNADFYADLSINCGALLQFTNTSNGPGPLTYYWNFGDPASGSDNFSNLQNPDHLYTSCGEFEVCLLISNGECIDTSCQIVLVEDFVPPNIICPPFNILDCDDDLDPLNTGFATATDNCDPNPVIQYSDAHFGNIPCSGEIIRTWIATDFCGNTSGCDQIIIVDDNIPPVVTCPADISLNCDDDLDPLNTGFATATDNCDPNPNIQYSDAHFGNIPCGGEIIRTWVATDYCGNTSGCDQIIIVDDNIAPVITGCPSDISIGGIIINGICEADVLVLSPIASDNCDNNVIIINDFNGQPDASDLYQMGTTLVIWTATDDCGNTATCSFSVTVQCLNDCCECGLNGTNGPNQILNGNFALGDNNFTSDILSMQNCIPGTYYIGQTFNDKCNLWPTTTGKKDCYLNSTNFLIIDGVAGGPSPTTLWRQPITVDADMTYCFSISTRSLYTQQNFTLDVKIFDSSGNQIGLIVGNPTVSGNLWVDHTYSWNCPTSGTFDLEIIQTSNGHFRDFGLDDICFSKVIPQDCCENFDSFCATVENAINFSVNHDSCKVTFQIGSLPDCDYIEWVNWGDGNQSFGNFESGDMPMHVYSGSGTYVICYLAIERDLDSLICFEKIICDTIELQCDACICHSDLTLTHGSNNIPVNCNTSFLHVFQCPIEDVSISGYFGCINPTSGLPCTSGPVSWKLDRPGGQSTIIGSQSNFQPLTFQASDLAVSGIYVLLLSTICPGSSDTCFCRISWLQEDCEDSCCIDFDIFLAAAASVQPNVQISNCSINANPTGLNDCMQITWDWGDGSPLDGPYFNNTSVSHTYSGNGIYTACFTIIEFSVYADSCWSTKYCFEVDCNPCDTVSVLTGITGYYPFYFDADDLSTFGNHGTVNGALLTQGNDLVNNSAYLFNGSSNSIVAGINNRGITDKVTLAAWVKTTENSNGQWVAGKYSFDEDRGYLLSIGDNASNSIGQVAFSGRDGSGIYHTSGFSSDTINDGEWHCIVGSAGNGFWRVYVDGILQNSSAGSSNDLTTPSEPFTIGWHTHPDFPFWMNGSIDNLLIYNRDLSEEDIRCLCEGIVPPTSICCEDFETFCENVENAVDIVINNDSCKVTLQIAGLPECDYIEWINWGDGSQSSGNFIAGDMSMHVYADSGTYIISYLAIELDDDGFICFEKVLYDTITVECDLIMDVSTYPSINVSLKIYPNPNSGIFTVELPKAAIGGMCLSIIDVTGQVLFEKTAEVGSIQQTMEIDLLPPGFYFLQLRYQDNMIIVEKIVKI